jgi:ATP-dependent Clp protease ATP-binding subunit ClpB
LKRVIQKWVQDPLAQMLLAGELSDGSTVKLSVSQGHLTINGKEVGGEADASSQPKPSSIVQFPKTDR